MRTLLQAAFFAAEKHKEQRRKDAARTPYINHPLAVANLLANEAGIDDEIVLCAALLHDTIEDTKTSADELSSLFGAQISRIVVEVSDDKSLSKSQRKEAQVRHAPGLSREAKLVKLADKICNLRDILCSPPPDWTSERKHAYFDWAQQVVAGMRGESVALEAIFDEVCARKAEIL